MSKFGFTLEKTLGAARATTFTTPHGDVSTPMYMPVGTQATVKAMDSLDVAETKAPILLANTYHLYLRPGTDVLQKSGGLHQFMNWPKPILTDSGGFQVFSLGAQKDQKQQMSREELLKHQAEGKLPNIQSTSMVKITDEGVHFTSHLDGTKHFFAPETAIEIQRRIGADVIMAFDECTPDNASSQYAQEALDRTHRWASQCVEYWESKQRQSVYGEYQALFGIIQGATHEELRKKSAQAITALAFDGIAVGGETIGYNMKGTIEIMDWIRSMLPENKPRYAMGLGRDPQNLLDAVEAGFDMFDCVAPTRLARNGAVYVGNLEMKKNSFVFETPYTNGRLNMGTSPFQNDNQVIQPGCDCYTCASGYSRAYLRHLYKVKELSYYRLASIHNVRFMIRLCEEMRQEILRS